MPFRFFRLLKSFLLEVSFPKIELFPNLPIVVVSAQNLRKAGGLSILLDFISEIHECRASFQVICFTYSSDIVPTDSFSSVPFTVVPLPLSSRSWFFRIYYEYLAFYLFSLTCKINLWIALHDLTPHVRA